jgi:hypothetical protein
VAAFAVAALARWEETFVVVTIERVVGVGRSLWLALAVVLA